MPTQRSKIMIKDKKKSQEIYLLVITFYPLCLFIFIYFLFKKKYKFCTDPVEFIKIHFKNEDESQKLYSYTIRKFDIVLLATG